MDVLRSTPLMVMFIHSQQRLSLGRSLFFLTLRKYNSGNTIFPS